MRLAAVLVLLAVAGCDAAGPRSDLAPAGYVVSAFVIAGQTESVILRVEGPEEYPCANYPLLVESAVGAGGLEARIVGVGEAPEICLTAIGPAVWAAELPADVDGYRVRLRLDGDLDTYKLTRDGDRVRIATLEASFSRAEEAE